MFQFHLIPICKARDKSCKNSNTVLKAFHPDY
ncbi:hypothetical protein Nmel_000941 [Mimus melanotis]